MNHQNELHELWQSEPVERGPVSAVPRFGLMDEMATPVYTPLSPWRRVSYVVGFAFMATFYWRHGPAGGWQQAAAWMQVAIGFAGAILLLAQRDRSRGPKPEETILSYRRASVAEFERQYKMERRILLLVWCGWIAAGILWAAAPILKHDAPRADEIADPVAQLLLFIGGAYQYRRAADAARSRLKWETE